MLTFPHDTEKGFGDGLDHEEKHLLWASYLGETLYWTLNLKILHSRRLATSYLFFDVPVTEMLYNHYSFHNFKLSHCSGSYSIEIQGKCLTFEEGNIKLSNYS